MINAAKRDTPKEFRINAAGRFKVEAAPAPGKDGKKKLPTFTMVGYTGDVMTPGGWMLPIIVDLDGVIVPSQQRPILRGHDHNRVVGHSTQITVGDDGILAEGVISGVGPDATEVVGLAANGFAWQASIGANPIRTEFLEAGEEATVNGREVVGPLTISRSTELGEISFVPLGADGGTSAVVTASKKKGLKSMFKKLLKLSKKNGIAAAQEFSDEDIDAMDETEAKAALKKCMADGDADEAADDADADGDDGSDAKAKAADDSDAEADDDSDAEADDEEPATAKAAINLKIAARNKTRAHARIQAGRKAEADEVRRVSRIKAACRTNRVTTVTHKGQRVDLAAHAIEAGWSVERTELKALRSARPTDAGNGQLVYSTTAPRVTDAVLECAVLQAAGAQFKLQDDEFYSDVDNGRASRRINARTQRQTQADIKARYPDSVQQAAHTLFKGRIGLQQVLTVAASQNGYRGREVINDDNLETVLRASNWQRQGDGIRADGTSSASIGNVLANVLNKFLLQGYLFVDQAWKEVAGIKPVKDFKPTKSINLFGDFLFEKTGTSGELKNANLGDQAFPNQADQYGKILTIDRKQIINDDLGALTLAPMLLGRGAGLKLNQLFWATFLDATQKDDGGATAFWAATHTIPNQQANSNQISGAGSALNHNSLQLAQQLFDKQVDPNGYPLGVDPEVLLYPPELDTTAWELMNSQFLVYGGGTSAVAKQPSDNKWKGRFKPVKARYLSNANFVGNSATAWYLLSNQAMYPVIEACFLGGQESPTIQQAGPDYQFDRLGVSVRGVYDFGIAYQNFRGGVKAVGV